MAAGHRNNAASNPNFSTTKPLDFSHGQIYRTENKDQPPLRRADFWTVEVARTKELSARDAWAQRLAAQTIRLRDRARGEAEAALSIRPARKTVPPDFPKRAPQARCNR